MNLLLIDANLLAHRCHKNGLDLSNDAGVPTGLEYGLARSLESLERKHPEHRIVLCWDARDAAARRRETCPAYKANRSPENDTNGALYPRVAAMRAGYISHLYCEAESSGLEADDVVFSLSRREGEHLILSNDKDLLQAVNEDVVVLKQGFRGKLHLWGPERVWKEYAVWPDFLPLLRAALGDASDNLPGCSALGRAQTAEYVRAVRYALARQERSLAHAVQYLVEIAAREEHRHSAKKWAAWTEFVASGQLLVNYDLMCLTSCEVTITEPTPDDDAVREYLQRMEFRSLRRARELDVFADEYESEEF